MHSNIIEQALRKTGQHIAETRKKWDDNLETINQDLDLIAATSYRVKLERERHKEETKNLPGEKHFC